VKLLAMTYSCMRLHTTIGAAAFHFRVRDGIGWCHSAMVARKGVEGRVLPAGGRAGPLVGWDVASVLSTGPTLSSRPRRLEVIWSSRTAH
jgi:hypothetical protein